MMSINEIKARLPDESVIPISKKQALLDDESGEHDRETIEYLDIALCFDIEAYSFYTDPGGRYLGHELSIAEGREVQKRAVMWAWGLAIGDSDCYLGRTWGEFVDVVNYLSEVWHTNHNHRCIIWVHNLSYDFQFFRKYFTWENVFAIDSRKVCYALTDTGIEFRCSYILTGYDADTVGKHLTKHSMLKLTGTIDYDVPRHTKTELTSNEMAYIEHDCLVITSHITEQIEIESGICHIPLTKTAYVRRYVRKACFRDNKLKKKYDYSGYRYKEFISGLTLDRFQYESCKRAFAGGFTHANPQHSEETMYNVSSLDVVSDYPAQILSRLYPVTPPEYIAHFDSEDDFNQTINNNCCVFAVHLYNVKAIVNFDHYLSYSRCTIPDGASYQLDNGRIVSADEILTTITNLDWFIIKRVYQFDRWTVSGFIRWGWGYLPKSIIEATLYLYEQKTTLKGNKEQALEYQSSKEMLNSIYGMMVTDILRPKIPYNLESNEWGQETLNGDIKIKIPLTDEETIKALDKYNDDVNRFLYYPWGVFITAYARFMLWEAILEFKDDYIYSDTDSIKCKNLSAHMDFIERHNAHMTKLVEKCLTYYGLDPSRARPRGISVGTWSLEDPIQGSNITYLRFKTVGAKRYMVQTEDGIHTTVAGVGKRNGARYITVQSREDGKDPFKFFERDMIIPPGEAGKLIPYYGDEEIVGEFEDHNGVTATYHELSYVHFTPGGYTMGLSTDYVDYLYLLHKGELY